MASLIRAGPLFHLVPDNDLARKVLDHSDNKRFLSSSLTSEQGLEIAFHIPPIPCGRVLARLGRNADLILQEIPENLREFAMCRDHAAFQMHPTTLVIVLSVRCGDPRSVVVSMQQGNQEEAIAGGCVLPFGQRYRIKIASYQFRLVWRQDLTTEALRELAIRDLNNDQARLEQLRSRDQPTHFNDSESNSWHATRLHSVKGPLVQETQGLRVAIGHGAFGKVFQTVDIHSGRPFAVEVKLLERIKHSHSIELLRNTDFGTNYQRIFMPLCDGNLASLAATCVDHDNLLKQVLEQMLKALDYLAYQQLCHRDVKPDNILFRNLGGNKYHFQLADFDLANYRQLATTICGTTFYQAPELYAQYGVFRQTPKMDVWSLFATVLARPFQVPVST